LKDKYTLSIICRSWQQRRLRHRRQATIRCKRDWCGNSIT